MMALFAGKAYYPTGGWNDFRSAHDDLIGALVAVGNLSNVDWWHIVNMDTLKMEKQGVRQ